MSPSGVEPRPARTPSSDELPPGASISRNTAFALLARLGSAVFTAALTLFLARYLGADEFGVFSLALGIGAVLLLPTDFGISNSTARFLAERRSSRAAVAEVLRTATRLKLALSGFVSAVLFALAGPIESAYDASGLAWAVRGMALAVLAQSLVLLYMSVADALTRVALTFRLVLSESAIEFGASLALVLLGFGAGGAAFGRAIGYAAGAGIGALLLVRVVGRHSGTLPEGERVGARRLATYGGALLVVEGAFTLFQQIDVLLIGALLSAKSVGLFQAPMRLTAFLHYPGISLASGVAPRLARRAGHEPEVGPFTRAIRYLVLLQAFITAVAVVWAEPIIRLLLGSEFGKSADVLRALGPFIFLTGFGALLPLAVNYLGEARRRMPIAIGAVLINIGIDLVLIPKIGITAGAIGTDAAYLLYVPAHYWLCRRILNLSFRPLALTIGRAALAAAAAAGVLALFGISSIGVPLMIVGGAAALAAYVAVLTAARELDSDDFRDARSLLGALRPSPGQTSD
jgi:O-antigen/teichoic acid export membrane protein